MKHRWKILKLRNARQALFRNYEFRYQNLLWNTVEDKLCPKKQPLSLRLYVAGQIDFCKRNSKSLEIEDYDSLGILSDYMGQAHGIFISFLFSFIVMEKSNDPENFCISIFWHGWLRTKKFLIFWTYYPWLWCRIWDSWRRIIVIFKSFKWHFNQLSCNEERF